MKNYFDLSGRVAVVTGCSTGLGVQMAKALANQGCSIVAVARRQNLIDEVATQIKEEYGVETLAVRCDITDTDMVNAMVDTVLEKFGRIDVLINNADSARKATEYLLQKGHRNIGYLAGEFRIKPFRSRFSGYKTALEKAEIGVDEDKIIFLSPTMDQAYLDMKEYLGKYPKKDLPTAFFADNDIIALGAMKAMWECGIRIPEDVSVVGFDDLTYSSISHPPLTTLRVPKQEMGRIAVRRLRDMIRDGDGLHLKTQVCTDFIERNSVRDLKQE